MGQHHDDIESSIQFTKSRMPGHEGFHRAGNAPLLPRGYRRQGRSHVVTPPHLNDRQQLAPPGHYIQFTDACTIISGQNATALQAQLCRGNHFRFASGMIRPVTWLSHRFVGPGHGNVYSSSARKRR